MESSKQQATDAAASGGRTARPHWRRRDPAATAVYVVHPAQFCTVVQQLTGAAASSPTAHNQQAGGNNGTTAPQQQHQPAAAARTTTANAAARQQHGGGASSGRTLGQMHQECMAWANSDDC